LSFEPSKSYVLLTAFRQLLSFEKFFRNLCSSAVVSAFSTPFWQTLCSYAKMHEIPGLNYSVIGGGALFCGHWNEHTRDDRGLVPWNISAI